MYVYSIYILVFVVVVSYLVWKDHRINKDHVSKQNIIITPLILCSFNHFGGSPGVFRLRGAEGVSVLSKVLCEEAPPRSANLALFIPF